MDDERYAALCDHALHAATAILAGAAAGVSGAPARYLLAESARLVDGYAGGGRGRPEGAAADALDAIVEAWPALRSGALSGEDLFADRPGLWRRLMEEWPMGRYAELVVEAFADAAERAETVVELGAGAGATTRRLRPLVRARGGELIATDLRYGEPRAIDFDRPLAGRVPQADAVVATNALHCARDPAATLEWIHEVLRPGGLLVLGEGAPFPEPGVPWALNLAFGACRGWYDGGGFRSPDFWLQALRRAGFVEVRRHAVPSGRYELGGGFVARASS